jgi:hypothetical protein
LKTSAAFLSILVLFISLHVKAQFYKNISLGLNAGAYVYQGDLSPGRYGSLKTIEPGISLFAKKPINKFLAARLYLSFASLLGDESRYENFVSAQGRNFSFSTPLTELSGQLVLNVRGNNKNEKGLMPYVFSGMGVTFIHVKKDFSRLDPAVYPPNSDVAVGLAIDNAKGTPRKLISIPAGAGLAYLISNRILINTEAAYRFIFTDYLDGFSQAVNPKQQDHFYSISAGFIYKLGKKENNLACPVIKY